MNNSVSADEFVLGNQRYRQLDQLGKGAQGQVYKVVHVESGKEYALKKVKISRFPQINEMNEQEVSIMRNLSKLKCPCIIKLIDEQKTSEYSLLLMELGQYSLDSYKKIFRTNLTDKETISLIKDIMIALKAVHQIKIIHRDIKPQNIIVSITDSKHPYKLTDFGVSAGKDARGCTYIGTEPYMAPEVILSRHQDNFYTQIADIWSFALVVFEAYFGFNPFFLNESSRIEQQIYLIDQLSENGFRFDKLLVVLEECKLHHLLPDLKKKYNDAPKEIMEFVGRGLHKNPQKRIKLKQIEKIFENTEDIPTPLLSKEAMKTNITKAKMSLGQIPNIPSINVAKSTNLDTPQMRKAASLNQTYTGVQNYDDLNQTKNTSFTNQRFQDNTSIMGMPQPSQFVQSSTYQAQSFSSQETVGRVSGSIMTPVIKSRHQQAQNLTQTFVPPASNMTQSQRNSDTSNSIHKATWRTFAGNNSKIINNEQSKFIQNMRKRIAGLYHTIKQLKDTEFSELLKKIDNYLNSQQYDQVSDCKSCVTQVYYKLYKLFQNNPQYLNDRKISKQYVIQFLYELILLANISAVTKDTVNAMQGLPQNITKLAFDADNYFKYPCNFEMLKKFQSKFFST